MQKSRVSIAIMTSAVCAAVLCGLSACSAGQHQIVQASQDCSECHASGVKTYEVSDPKGAIEVNTTFTVNISGAKTQVIVCTPTFTTQDGSACTPVQKMVVNASNGKAEVKVDAGIWAIAISGTGSSTYKIVKASASCANTEISL